MTSPLEDTTDGVDITVVITPTPTPTPTPSPTQTQTHTAVPQPGDLPATGAEPLAGLAIVCAVMLAIGFALARRKRA